MDLARYSLYPQQSAGVQLLANDTGLDKAYRAPTAITVAVLSGPVLMASPRSHARKSGAAT